MTLLRYLFRFSIVAIIGGLLSLVAAFPLPFT